MTAINILLKVNTAAQTLYNYQIVGGQGKTGQPIRVPAQANVKYQLIDELSGYGPEKVATRRSGRDLQIAFEGGDIEHPDLIITDYYAHNGAIGYGEGSANTLIGQAENGQFFNYIPESALPSEAVSLLADGAQAMQVLGGQNYASALWAAPALAGAGASGAAAAAAAASAGLSPGALAGLAALGLAAGAGGGGGGGGDGGNGNANNNPQPPAPTDTTPPGRPGLALSPKGSKITGSAEPGSLVTIKDANGAVIGNVTAGPDGKFELPLNPALTNGQTLTATAKDAAGNQSPPATATAPDIIAPDAPTATVIGDGNTVTGKAEAGSTVIVKDAGGNVLGEAQAGPDGTYTVPLKTQQINGQTLTVTATDAAHNTSKPTNAQATDTTAPAAPSVHISADGTTVTGIAEPGSTVIVRTEDGKTVQKKADANGKYTVELNPPQTNGEKLKVTAADPTGNTSDPTPATAPDTTAPSLDEATVSPNGTTVTGKAEAGSLVTVMAADGKTVLGTGTADADGNYSVTLSTPQTNGQTLTVTATDAAGNTSTPKDAQATDTTAPDAPSAQVSADGTSVTGKAEPGSKVTVKDASGKELGTGTADNQGNYTVTLDPPQTNGQKLQVTATDAAENTSPPTTATAHDATAPDVPAAFVSADGKTVSGTAEPGSSITVKDSKGNIIGTGKADASTGVYSVELTNPQTTGANVGVTATDKAGNTSEEATAPSIDSTPPDMPTGTVSPDGKTVSGTAEPGSLVIIKDKDGKEIGRGPADASTGAYTITLEPQQTAGNKVTAKAQDLAGNTSEAAKIDSPDLIAPTAPEATVSSNGKTVTGTAEAGSTVIVKDASGNVLGEAQAGPDGTYTVPLKTQQINGQTLKVTATDTAGNQSPPAQPTAPDITPPAAPSAQVSADGSKVTGTAEPGSTVTVKSADGNTVLGTGTASTDGKYTITLTPSQTNGEKLKVTAKDAADNTSPETPATAPDITAPDTPSAYVSSDGTTVTGTAEAGSTVTVMAADGKTVLGTGTADADGNYSVTLSTPQTNGQTLTVTATDAAHNTSKPANAQATDTTAPAAPSVHISADGSKVTGIAEPGSKVTVTLPNGSTTSTTAGSDGTYTIPLSPPQTNGQTLKVTAQDAAGNTSPETPATAPDTTAPSAPSANVSADGKFVTGKAEGETSGTVIVKDADGKTIGTAPINPDGSYTVALDPPQTNGQKLTVTAVDPAGNPSASTDAQAKDITAPDAPSAQVSAGGTSVTGKAEPGSKVTVKDASGKELGTGTADNQGNYTVTLDPPQTNGQKLQVTATDAAENTSPPTTATAHDTTAPDVPAAFVSADGKTVSGTAEPGSSVTVTDAAGKPLGSADAGPDGTYSITLSSPQTDGSSLNVTATDAAGNQSPPAHPVAPDTTPPAQPSTETPKVLDNVGEGGVPLAAGDETPIESDTITNDATPTVVVPKAVATAAAAAGDSLQLVVDGKVVAATVGTDADGNTTLSPQTPLADGAHTISYLQQDAAGNQSPPAPALSFNVDATAPAQPAQPASYKDNEGSVRSDTSTAPTTDDTTPGLNIGKNLDGAPKLYVDGNFVASNYDPGTGTLTPTTPLSQGKHALTYTLTDTAGNLSLPSEPLVLTIDTTKPEKPAAPTSYKDNEGSVQSDTSTAPTTDDTTPGLNVGAGLADTPKLYEIDGNGNKTEITAVYDKATGTLTPTAALREGAHKLAYTLTDAAGNESEPSEPLALTIDTTAPAQPAAPTSYKDNEGSVQSETSTAPTTDDTTPGLNIGKHLADTPKLYVNDELVASTYDPVAGTLTPLTPLPEGPHKLAYSLTDAAGNESATSEPLALTIDTTAPSAPDQPTSYTDNMPGVVGDAQTAPTTNDSTPGLNIGKNLADTPKLYEINADGSKTEIPAAYDPDTGTLTPLTPLPEGPHKLAYTLTDAAGNESAPSESLALTIDTSAPAQATIDQANAQGVKVGLPADAKTGDTVTIKYTDNAGEQQTVTLTKQGDGSWKGDPSGSAIADVPADTNTATIDADKVQNGSFVTATSADAAGNAATPASALVNANPPPTAVIEQANSNGVRIALPSAALTGDTVKVSYGGTSELTFTKQPNGTWTSSDSSISPNADGVATIPADSVAHDAVITATTIAATGNMANTTATMDKVAPDAPAINTPNKNTDVKITLEPGTNKDAQKVKITYQGEDGQQHTAELSKDTNGAWTSNDSNVVVNNNNGVATIDASKIKDNGQITATSTDDAGNVSAPAMATMDKTPPAAAPLSYDATSKTITIDLPSSPKEGDTVKVTYTPEGSSPSQTVVLTANSNGSWTSSDSDVIAHVSSGNDATLPASKVSNGTTVSTASSDKAGNTSPTMDLPLDKVAPTDTTIDPTNGQTLHGTAEAGSTVTITGDGNFVGTAVADANGKWQFNPTPDLGHGVTLNVTAKDAAGNVSPAATTVVDATAPAVKSITLDKTSLKAGDTTAVTIEFTEKVSDFGNDNVTVTNGTLDTFTSTDGGLTWKATFTPNAGVDNNVAADEPPPPNTTLTVHGGYKDAVGNVASASTEKQFIVDTVAPTVAFEAVNSKGIRINVEGAPIVNVKYWKDKADFDLHPEDGTAVERHNNIPLLWASDIKLPNGAYVQAIASDVAGNQAVATVVSVDTSAPEVFIRAASEGIGGWVSDQSKVTLTVTFKPKDVNQVPDGFTETESGSGLYSGEIPLDLSTDGSPVQWQIIGKDNQPLMAADNSTVTVVAKDAVGNLASNSGDAGDTTPPSLEITAINNQGISGTLSDNGGVAGCTVKVTYTAVGGTLHTEVPATVDPTAKTWSLPGAMPKEGTDVSVIVADAAGNSAKVTQSVQDTTAPEVKSIEIASHSGADQTYIAGDTILVKVSFNEAVTLTNGDASIVLQIGNQEVQANLLSGNGSTELLFEYTVPTYVADNTSTHFTDSDGIAVKANSFVLHAGGKLSDLKGNIVDTTVAGFFNGLADSSAHQVDNVPPPAPQTAPVVQDNVDTDGMTALVGAAIQTVPTGGKTNDNTPSVVVPQDVMAALETGAKPVLVVDGKPVPCSSAQQADGSTILTPSIPLGEGEHTLSYLLQDKLGNQSAPAPSVTITVDTVPPAAPTVQPDMTSASDSGSSDADNVTKETKPAFAVPAPSPEAGGETPTPVLLVDGKLVAATYDATTGTLTPTAPLSEGTHNIAYALQDAAGNISQPGPSLSVTIDTTAPSAPSVAIAEAGDGYVNQSEASDGVQVQVTLPAGAQVGDVITLTLKPAGGGNAASPVLHTVTADDVLKGTATVTVPQQLLGSDGARILSTQYADKAGNTVNGDDVSFTLDTTPPAAPVVTPKAQGAVDVAPPADCTHVKLSYTDAAGKAQSLSISKNAQGWALDGGGALPAGVALDTATGTVSFTAGLLKDSSLVSATATDAAGNTGLSASANVDATPPAAATVTPKAQGVVEVSNIAADATKLVLSYKLADGTPKTVTLEKTGSTWAFEGGTTPDGLTLDPSTGALSFAAGKLEGNSTVTATSSDAAGNSSSKGGTVFYNSAPVIDPAANGNLGEDDTTPITGTINFSDADPGDTHTASFKLTSGVWSHGALTELQKANLNKLSITLPSDGNTATWTYTPNSAAAQFLAAGETITLTYQVSIKDNSGQSNNTATRDITITITGTQDAPRITSNTDAAQGSVTELGATNTTGGMLKAENVDANAGALTWSLKDGKLQGIYGSISLNANSGKWEYTLDNSKEATLKLAANQTVEDQFTALVTDGKGGESSQTITVTVKGVDNAPTASWQTPDTQGTLGGQAVGAGDNVTKNGTVNVTGTTITNAKYQYSMDGHTWLDVPANNTFTVADGVYRGNSALQVRQVLDDGTSLGVTKLADVTVDTVAPTLSVRIDPDTLKSVTVMTEAYAYVQIQKPDGSSATQKADEFGRATFTLSAPFSQNQTIVVKAMDAAGNLSEWNAVYHQYNNVNSSGIGGVKFSDIPVSDGSDYIVSGGGIGDFSMSGVNTGNVTVDTKSGDDVIIIKAALTNLTTFLFKPGAPECGVFTIDTGAGNDLIDIREFANTNIPNAWTRINMGTGDDACLIHGNQTAASGYVLRGNTIIDMGAGNDTVKINGWIDPSAVTLVKGGDGVDSLTFGQILASDKNYSTENVAYSMKNIQGFENINLNGSNYGLKLSYADVLANADAQALHITGNNTNTVDLGSNNMGTKSNNLTGSKVPNTASIVGQTLAGEVAGTTWKADHLAYGADGKQYVVWHYSGNTGNDLLKDVWIQVGMYVI